MNARAQAAQKALLVERCAFARRHVRGQAGRVRLALGWKGTTWAVASMPSTRGVAFGAALALMGRPRAARWLMFAQGVLGIGRVARALLGRRA